MGGVNEVLAVILMADEVRQSRCARTPAASACASTCSTSSIFDYIAVSGSLEDRVCEYVDHLHEHFVDPCVIEQRALRGAAASRLQHRHQAAVDRRLRVPGRASLGSGMAHDSDTVMPPVAEARPRALGHLRAAVLRHDHQLRRPPVLGILAPTLQNEIGWTDVEYGYIIAAFRLAYAIGFLFVRLVHRRVGTGSATRCR